MTNADHPSGHAMRGDYVVRAPRSTDAIGKALKGVYATASMPADMQALIARLDHVTRH